MRRGTDRIQAVMRAGLLVLFLAGAPAAAWYVSHGIYVSGVRAGQVQAAAWHRVPAVVLRVTPIARGWWRPMPSRAQLSLRWAAPHGSWRTGEIMIARHAVPGSTVAVWVDGKGRLAHQPLSRAEVTEQVIRAAVATPVALALLLAAAGGVVSLLLDRHRLACWEADWSAVEPQWNRSGPTGDDALGAQRCQPTLATWCGGCELDARLLEPELLLVLQRALPGSSTVVLQSRGKAGD